MKIYFAPAFARQVESSSKRVQNLVKAMTNDFERHHARAELLSRTRQASPIRVEELRDPDLYSIQLHEVRILASLVTDRGGEYWIFAQLAAPTPDSVPRVMIKCPNTGKAVFTGIAMPRSTFDGAVLEKNSIQCPVCGQEHVWNKTDAFLEET